MLSISSYWPTCAASDHRRPRRRWCDDDNERRRRRRRDFNIILAGWRVGARPPFDIANFVAMRSAAEIPGMLLRIFASSRLLSGREGDRFSLIAGILPLSLSAMQQKRSPTLEDRVRRFLLRRWMLLERRRAQRRGIHNTNRTCVQQVPAA